MISPANEASKVASCEKSATETPLLCSWISHSISPAGTMYASAATVSTCAQRTRKCPSAAMLPARAKELHVPSPFPSALAW